MGGGGGKSWSPWQPMFEKQDWGKGWGKGFGGFKGKGKGKKKQIDTTKTIWIGNVPEGTTYQELKAHGEQAGGAKWAEVFNNKGKGTGAIGYSSAEEAAAAVAILNGTVLKARQSPQTRGRSRRSETLSFRIAAARCDAS